MDKFNLQGYLKNNQLLNENIGGYVDMKPVNANEEIGTAMGEEDLGYAKHGGDFSGDDSEYGGGRNIDDLISQKYLASFVDAIQTMIDDLEVMGFKEQDVKNFLINKMSDI